MRENLAAIGIELEIRRFSFGEMFARVMRSPTSRSTCRCWAGSATSPIRRNSSTTCSTYYSTTGFLDRTRLGRRIRAASRLSGPPRIEAYAALDREIAAQAAPFVPVVSATATDFFSARIGCQVEHPLYGIDLAALCVRDK